MEIDNLNLINENNIVERDKTEFLETVLGKIINNAIDIGLRIILPDFIEEQIMDVKDNLLKHGLKEGITKTIDDIINVSKKTIGIVTGNIEKDLEMKDILDAEEFIKSFSTIIDFSLNNVKQKGEINDSIINAIISGKDVIIKNIEENIEETLKKQEESINYLEKHINNWKQNFENRNFIEMEKEYKNIKEEMTSIIPFERIINEAKEIEMMHNLIKNNGQDFNVIQEQQELIESFRKF